MVGGGGEQRMKWRGMYEMGSNITRSNWMREKLKVSESEESRIEITEKIRIETRQEVQESRKRRVTKGMKRTEEEQKIILQERKNR